MATFPPFDVLFADFYPSLAAAASAPLCASYPGQLRKPSATTRRGRRPRRPEPPSFVPRKKDGFPRRPSGPPRNDKGFRTVIARSEATWQSASPVPTSFVTETPRIPGMVSKGRAAALPLVVSRGSRGEIRNPPGNLSWEARGDILLIRKEYPLASRRPSSAALRPHRGRPTQPRLGLTPAGPSPLAAPPAPSGRGLKAAGLPRHPPAGRPVPTAGRRT